MLDNGAFSAWRKGRVPDWHGYYRWCERWLDYHTTWAVIPDVIDGDVSANDALLAQWPHGRRGAPVWHMHMPIARLLGLCERWPRVCIGSSGEYAVVGDARWHARMASAMNALCGNGPAPAWLHMLRGGALMGSEYPFASVDSTNVAQNHKGIPSRRQPPQDIGRMVAGLEARQCGARWARRPEQQEISWVA